MDRIALSRRGLFRLGAAALWPGRALPMAEPVRFGVIADVHHGLATRTEERLEAFLSDASQRNLDFIVQMGDFHHPEPEAKGFLDLWNAYRRPRYGVLGNHDMDKGSKAQILDLWQIHNRYYSFEAGFLHFVVLDANHMQLNGRLVPYDRANWYRSGITASWVDLDQLEWLRQDLNRIHKPTIVLIHQGIDEAQGGGAVPNRDEVRRVLEGSGKVCAVLMGHHHVDTEETRNEIWYWRVNSASYAWVGEEFGRMAHYDRALYGIVTIWPDGTAEVEGRRGMFEGESPFVRGVPEPDRFSASLRSRKAKFKF